MTIVVQQMEVPCYTDSKVEEFTERIQKLKREYQAYMHKLRTLEPDVSASSWSSRPYGGRKRQVKSYLRIGAEMNADKSCVSNDPGNPKESETTSTDLAFEPIATPVLQNKPVILFNLYGCNPPPAVVWNANPQTQDEPLQFGPQGMYTALNQEVELSAEGRNKKGCIKDKEESIVQDLPNQSSCMHVSIMCENATKSVTFNQGQNVLKMLPDYRSPRPALSDVDSEVLNGKLFEDQDCISSFDEMRKCHGESGDLRLLPSTSQSQTFIPIILQPHKPPLKPDTDSDNVMEQTGTSTQSNQENAFTLLPVIVHHASVTLASGKTTNSSGRLLNLDYSDSSEEDQ